jgi:hypothetical protein
MGEEKFNLNGRYRRVSDITFSAVGRQNILNIALYETVGLRPK